jgi:hypothetical protein
VAAVVAALTVLLTPGTALAYYTVAPVVDCATVNADNSVTYVVGYTNSSGRVQNIGLGYSNYQQPSRIQGTQPTTFQMGTVHGAFTVTLAWWEVGNASWSIDGRQLDYQNSAWMAPKCPTGTQLPADGNGTGTAIGLGAAGLVGAFVLLRMRRRRPASPTA